MILFLLYVYNTIISFFAFIKPKRPRMKLNPKSHHDQSFTILIPCHNEESVIKGTIESIKRSYYSNYNLYVIADNCSDNTIEIAKQLIPEKNILIVNGGSKPKAINAAVKILKNTNRWTDDNIVIIDADNRVTPTMLLNFNLYHNYYENSLLQVKIKSHNDKSFIAKGFTSSFNTMSESFQFARNQLKLSASLCGTGFSIPKFIWDEVGFTNCTSLTEDLEFSILCIIKGYKTIFIPEEYILNQNLNKLKPSIIQRLRWARGYMQVSIKLSLKLLKNFFKCPSLQLFDSFIFINTPSKTFIYLLFNLTYFIFDINFIPKLIIIILFIYNLFFILYCNKFKLRYIVPHLFFSFCTTFILIASVFTFKNTKWAKTKHENCDN